MVTVTPTYCHNTLLRLILNILIELKELAPTHNNRRIQEILNETFNAHVILNRGSIKSWPAIFAYISPTTYFLLFLRSRFWESNLRSNIFYLTFFSFGKHRQNDMTEKQQTIKTWNYSICCNVISLFRTLKNSVFKLL